MIKSMTGFGRAESTLKERAYIVEIKSLNGKLLDINLKIPPILKPYEFDIRSLLQEKLVRGSIECYITLKQNGSVRPVVINTELVRNYYLQMKDLANELSVGTEGLLAALLRLPEVVAPSAEVADESEWMGLKEIINNAINDIDKHRCVEGEVLRKELRTRVENIQKQERLIEKLEPQRKEKIKSEMMRMLGELVNAESYDANRLEQEMIYYIEKIDIREEQVRLRNHCNYFLEILDNDTEANGKRLSFVLQEIGREINTTGSKAYDSDIQKCVVLMKDELEKAKEQTFNVL